MEVIIGSWRNNSKQWCSHSWLMRMLVISGSSTVLFWLVLRERRLNSLAEKVNQNTCQVPSNTVCRSDGKRKTRFLIIKKACSKYFVPLLRLRCREELDYSRLNLEMVFGKDNKCTNVVVILSCQKIVSLKLLTKIVTVQDFLKTICYPLDWC